MSASVTKVLLTIHVLAAIIAIGPVTVAASMFPGAVRRADLPTLRILHRICRVYAVLGVLVPVFGLATATSLGVLGDAWLLTSIALTLVAAGLLVFVVLPGQSAALTSLSPAPAVATVASSVQAPLSAGSAQAPLSAGSAHPADTPPAARSTGPADALLGAGDSAGARFGAGVAGGAARLGMATGIFNLLWAVVVVLMIVRPGSTTGA